MFEFPFSYLDDALWSAMLGRPVFKNTVESCTRPGWTVAEVGGQTNYTRDEVSL